LAVIAATSGVRCAWFDHIRREKRTCGASCVAPEEAAKVDWLKPVSPVFATMRQLAMRFRGLLRGRDSSKLDAWLDDACATGLHSIQRLTHYLRHDIEAVCNAISESWSNGQTEGQINRPKTLKCAMYERAGTELLRARMLPLRG
jgi:transposase